MGTHINLIMEFSQRHQYEVNEEGDLVTTVFKVPHSLEIEVSFVDGRVTAEGSDNVWAEEQNMITSLSIPPMMSNEDPAPVPKDKISAGQGYLIFLMTLYGTMTVCFASWLYCFTDRERHHQQFGEAQLRWKNSTTALSDKAIDNISRFANNKDLRRVKKILNWSPLWVCGSLAFISFLFFCTFVVIYSAL